MILSYLKNTVDNRYPTDKILKRTTKMHPFKQQYLQGARKLNRRSVMRHQLPQNVLDLPQQCLFNRCSLLKQVARPKYLQMRTRGTTPHEPNNIGNYRQAKAPIGCKLTARLQLQLQHDNNISAAQIQKPGTGCTKGG